MLITILKIWAVGLALLVYGGWGLAHWLTPPSLRSVRPLLVPFFGYALLIIPAYYLLWLGVPLDRGRWLIAGLATLLNAAALWRRRGAARAALAWDELGLAAGVALVAGLVAVAPLLAHGQLAPIGDSWDVEFYLPLAEYLRHYGYAQLGQAPANPLVLAIQADPTYARAMGFSYFQALVDGVRDWPALGTFAPLLGLMRLLAAVAVWLFARHGLRTGRWAATAAALLVAGNELLLWIEYTGFGMHTASMALVPMSVLLLLLALRELRWPTTAAAALVLAALATTYHPGLLGFGALAGGAGLWHLARGPRRGAVLAHGLAVAGGAGALTFLVQLRAERAFFQVYAQGAVTMGVEDYIGPPTWLGLRSLALQGAAAPPPWGAAMAGLWPGLAGLAVAIVAALALLWLVRGRGERGLALAMGATALLYALGLRQLSDFYGYMKGLSFVAFAALVVAAAGLETVAAHGRWRWPRLGLALGAAAVVLLVTGATAWNSYALVRGGPALYDRERLRRLELPALVPPGAPVFVSGAEELRGPTMGLAAYALHDHPLLGRTATGYVVFEQLRPGDAAPFGLLGPHDDPAAWGFAPTPLWRSALAALYAAPAGRLAHLHGQAAAYTADYPTALHRTTALELAQLGQGAFTDLQRPLDLAVGAAQLTLGTTADGPSAARTVVLQIGATAAATLQVTGGLQRTVALTPGLNLVTLPALPVPATLRLQSDRPALLRWAELYADAAPAAPPSAVITVQTMPTPGGATLALSTAAGAARLRTVLEIYEDSTTPAHYGWGALPATSGAVTLDLAGRTVQANDQPVAMTWGERRAGRYFAALWVYQGQALLQRIPLLRFTDSGSAITDIAALDGNGAFATLTQPATAQPGQFGGARLLGTTWTPARPGRAAGLAVWWQADGPTAPLLTTAQLLGDNDHKWAQWDGLLGGDAAPSAGWRPGEIIRQDIPLPLDAQTPAAGLRLLLGVYQPDGVTLPFVPDGGAPQPAGLMQPVTLELP